MDSKTAERRVPVETITSRKNSIIRRLRALGRERSLRQEEGFFVGDGEKLLREAIASGAEVETVLWAEKAAFALPENVRQLTAPAELVEYVSALSKSTGPVFTVRIPERSVPARPDRVLVLETVQDPGNVGTVLRTANAFGADAVLLTGACADLYSPKTVRATMGAIFRQPVLECTHGEMRALLEQWELPLYGAALTDTARDLRKVSLRRAAVAVGSEGRGLSAELLDLCGGQIIIPMRPDSESLNAAVAASVILWEMVRAGDADG